MVSATDAIDAGVCGHESNEAAVPGVRLAAMLRAAREVAKGAMPALIDDQA